jgi:subtilisin family serine protease
VAAAIARLRSNLDVEFSEPNWVYYHQATSNDPYYTNGSLWGMYGDATSPTNQYGSQAGEAWAAGHTGSAGVYVGIIDEGFMWSHADLSANSWVNPYDPVDGVDNDGNGYVDDVRGWDFDGNNNSTYDGTQDDHGTHVAGTIGAVGGNGAGVAGVNWRVTLISGKFLGRRGGTTANAIKAVDYFTDLKNRHGLNIVATNNSWGGGGFSQALLDAINRGGNAGILFIAAAGNGGSDGVGDNNDTVASYPSNYTCTSTYGDCVIAVAALTSTGAKASYSNYGKTTVDLGAPGSGIYSTLPGKNNSSTYGSYSGTSMATPHVTGAAALYASTHSGASADQIKAAILNATVATSSMNNITVTGGRLNVSGF